MIEVFKNVHIFFAVIFLKDRSHLNMYLGIEKFLNFAEPTQNEHVRILIVIFEKYFCSIALQGLTLPIRVRIPSEKM